MAPSVRLGRKNQTKRSFFRCWTLFTQPIRGVSEELLRDDIGCLWVPE